MKELVDIENLTIEEKLKVIKDRKLMVTPYGGFDYNLFEDLETRLINKNFESKRDNDSESFRNTFISKFDNSSLCNFVKNAEEFVKELKQKLRVDDKRDEYDGDSTNIAVEERIFQTPYLTEECAIDISLSYIKRRETDEEVLKRIEDAENEINNILLKENRSILKWEKREREELEKEKKEYERLKKKYET